MSSGDRPLMKDGEPFPSAMQGRWLEESEPAFELVILDHELFMRGERQDYVRRRLIIEENEICGVQVARPFDTYDEDELCLFFSGDEMYAFSVHSVSLFIRGD